MPNTVVDIQKAREIAQQSAKDIENQMGVDMMLAKLLDMPRQIREQQDAVQAAKQIVDEAKGEVELQEALLTAAISEEKDPKTGRAAFSNETARKAELAKRMSVSEGYKEAAQYLVESESAHRAAQFDLEMLMNEFAALRTASRMVTERLALLRVA